MSKRPLVSLRSIGKTYVDALHTVIVFEDLDLDFFEGEITAVLGPTGCGKSTLLGIINGLTIPSKGTVNFARPRQTLRIGTKLQKDLLLPWRTVRGNARLAREIVNSVESDEGKITEMLGSLGLLEYQDLHPDQISGGMRQKLALARTLLLDPDLLLLDEPFTNIDFHQKLDLERLCYEWIREKERTAIIVTHDVEEAIAIADRTVVFTKKPMKITLDTQSALQELANDPWSRRKDSTFYKSVEQVVAALSSNSET